MYSKILVPLDSSRLAECVIPHVEALSAGCHVSEVILVAVVESKNLPSWAIPVPEADAGLYPVSEKYDEGRRTIEAEFTSRARRYLRSTASRMNCGSAKARTVVLTGKASEEIARYADDNKVDLIVIATHGRSGVSRWVLGSVADRILRSSAAPVLMVRAPGCEPGA